MTRLAVTAVAAMYAVSLAGLATVLRAPEPPRAQADGRSATTLVATEGQSACRIGAEMNVSAARAPWS
jgi:hypothetical protein